MPIHDNIQAWRKARGCSAGALAQQLGMTTDALAALEAGETDPTVSIVEQIAAALDILPAWVHSHPRAIQLVMGESNDDEEDANAPPSPDPVTHQIVRAMDYHRELYVLLTALLHTGEPKLLRAMEVNLRSLLKQAQRATVPWESRIPGHFEPPSD